MIVIHLSVLLQSVSMQPLALAGLVCGGHVPYVWESLGKVQRCDRGSRSFPSSRRSLAISCSTSLDPAVSWCAKTRAKARIQPCLTNMTQALFATLVLTIGAVLANNSW